MTPQQEVFKKVIIWLVTIGVPSLLASLLAAIPTIGIYLREAPDRQRETKAAVSSAAGVGQLAESARELVESANKVAESIKESSAPPSVVEIHHHYYHTETVIERVYVEQQSQTNQTDGQRRPVRRVAHAILSPFRR